MNIRIATEEDIPRVSPLLAEMHRGTGLNFPKINPEKTVNKLFEIIRSGILLLAETKTGELAGVLALVEGEFWFSSGRFVSDLVFYVTPKHRKSSAAIKLLSYAKKIVDNMKVPLVLAVFNGVDIDRKEEFMLKMGFKKVGGSYGRGM